MDPDQEDVVLEFEKILGEGSFGVVYLVKNTETETRYAVKRISFRGQESDRVLALKEADILSKIQHKHILQYIESFEDEDCLNIVTEYCDGGDLEVYIQRWKKKKIPEKKFVPWIYQIANALHYLHSKMILHRDLKTKNIFLMRDLSIKVGDLGIAKVLDLHQSKAQSFVGTPSYMSPELFLSIPYNQKSDIWSLGCVAYEMVAFKKAFGSGGLYGVLQNVMSGKMPEMPKGSSETLQNLIYSMLRKDPEKRPTADDIMQHHYIQQYTHMPKDGEEDDIDHSELNGTYDLTMMESSLTVTRKSQARSQGKKRPLKRSHTFSSSWGQVKGDIKKKELESQSHAIARTMGKMSELKLNKSELKLNKARNVWDTNSGAPLMNVSGNDLLETFVVHPDEEMEEDMEDSGTFVYKGSLREKTLKRRTENMDTFVYKGLPTVKNHGLRTENSNMNTVVFKDSTIDNILSRNSPAMNAKLMVQGLKDRLTPFDIEGEGMSNSVNPTHAQVAMPTDSTEESEQHHSEAAEQKSTKKKKKKKFLQKEAERRRRLSSDSSNPSTSQTKETSNDINKSEKVTLFTRSQQVSFKPGDDESEELEDTVVQLRPKKSDEKWKPFEKRKTTASIRNLVELVGSVENRPLVMEQITLLKEELEKKLGNDTLKKCYEIMLSVEDDQIIKAVLRDLLGPKNFDEYCEQLFILRMMELSMCAKD